MNAGSDLSSVAPDRGTESWGLADLLGQFSRTDSSDIHQRGVATCRGVRGGAAAAALIFGMPSRPSASPEVALDDVRVVRRMAGGDSPALGVFYNRWSGEVYATAISIVRGAQDAEEVVEDTFWQAWTQASRFDAARGEVRSWVLSIARTRALDKLKSVARRREEGLELAPPELLAKEGGADDRIVEEERASAIARALNDLPPGQREALEMAYFGGLSQTEIADCTGLAIGTIKTRIRLGMQKLRERLAPAQPTV
jgi:RNA polymerase sigma-70 factor, ECF subfamily